MEAPTSRYTGSNLHNIEHPFFLAPPCHPGFSGCNLMEATTSCVQAPTWTSEDYSPPEHLPTTLTISNNEYTYNYTDKSILTNLSLYLIFNKLFCSSIIPLVVLAGQLCITFYVLFYLSFLFYFCSPFHLTLCICFLSCYTSTLFLFLLFTHFSIPNNQPNSVSFIFFYTGYLDDSTSPSSR